MPCLLNESGEVSYRAPWYSLPYLMGEQPVQHICLDLLRGAVAHAGKDSPLLSDELLSADFASLPNPEKVYKQLVVLLLLRMALAV